jgi:hypothetical protein
MRRIVTINAEPKPRVGAFSLDIVILITVN